MDGIKFQQSNQQQSVKLTLNKAAVRYRFYVDLIVAIDSNVVVIDYPLSVNEYERYQRYAEIIHSIVIQHKLHDRRESRLHGSNLLFYAMQFDRKHAELIGKEEQYAMVNNMIDFLRVAKRLSPVEKQKVQISLLIKNQPFAFKNQPILSEIVLNKLLGVTTDTIRNGYPELWKQYFEDGTSAKSKPEKAKALSVLRNVGVAEITKQIIIYLNKHSVILKNSKAQMDKITITSKQGNFIYDLLTELGVYKPTNAVKKNTGKKDAPYHSLRKLINRY